MLLTLRKCGAWCRIFTQTADFSMNRSFQPILFHLLRCLSVTYHYSHKIRTRYKSSPLRSALICDITQHRVVIPYQRFGITYRLSSRTSPLKMGPIGCPRNVSTEWPLYAAQYPRRVQISSTSRWEPEITQSPHFPPPWCFCHYSLLYSSHYIQYSVHKNSSLKTNMW